MIQFSVQSFDEKEMIYLPTTDAAQNTGGYFRQKLLFPMS
jgi:hypothetical protein